MECAWHVISSRVVYCKVEGCVQAIGRNLKACDGDVVVADDAEARENLCERRDDQIFAEPMHQHHSIRYDSIWCDMIGSQDRIWSLKHSALRVHSHSHSDSRRKCTFSVITSNSSAKCARVVIRVSYFNYQLLYKWKLKWRERDHFVGSSVYSKYAQGGWVNVSREYE